MNLKSILFIITLSFLFACQEENNEIQLVNSKVTINHLFGNELVLFNDNTFQNAAGNELSLVKVRYLLSNITLTKSNGKIVKLDSLYAFLDPARNQNSFDLLNIEEGSYTNISFDIGVDSLQNHSDPTKLPANHPLSLINHNLHWGWIDGYIFLSLEGYLHYMGQTQSFTYHMGFDRNKRRISLDYDLDLSNNSQINIDFDIAKLFDATHQIDQSNEVFISHSVNDKGLSDRLMDNSLEAFTIQGVLK